MDYEHVPRLPCVAACSCAASAAAAADAAPHNGLSARIMFSISNVGVCHGF